MFSQLRSFLTAWARRERFEDALDEEVRFRMGRAACHAGGMHGAHDRKRRRRPAAVEQRRVPEHAHRHRRVYLVLLPGFQATRSAKGAMGCTSRKLGICRWGIARALIDRFLG